MHLDSKEKALLLMISHEMDFEEIASVLQTSVQDLTDLTNTLIEKFAVKSEVGLIKKAIKEGFISNDI